MSSTITSTVTETIASLSLRSEEPKEKEAYRYEHLLPTFTHDHYPPLTPFVHVDPGSRALSHSNPRSFLDGATSIVELTPALGTEVVGVNLVHLDSDARDQLALEVAQSHIVRYTSDH
jgi:sulfonate dioxygenase